MKTLLAIAALCLAASASTETKGNITLTVADSGPGLDLEIQSTDSTVTSFVVVVWVTKKFGADTVVRVATKMTAIHSPVINPPARLHLAIDRDRVQAIYVTEIHPGQVQQFGKEVIP